MRNDSNNWAMIDTANVTLTGPGATLEWAEVERQTIVSGVAALTHFQDVLGPAVGWPDVATGPGYAVALRRDCVLLVDGPQLDNGWDETANLAISDMTGGYEIFDLSAQLSTTSLAGAARSTRSRFRNPRRASFPDRM